MFEAMNEFGVDTLKAARALEAAGFETAQAETLVTVFRGFAVGNLATKGQVRDLETALKTETTALHAKIESEIRDLRTEFDGKIDGKIDDLRTEVKGDIAELRLSVEGLKTRMFQLMLGQVVVIVGLIVSLDRLL